ncbi:hypothetical protein [Nakamurella aerolata]|uniref:Uncharacterized protein n=1 Tax=Nakamurella aerolata TaxID=1656892 RepID=A0A849A9Q4_9ACTN|nr:hypothetical protein [Nakamurella aerolata]NNG36697.1 hypothetical protein [Nakamurella aerolata]
MSSMVPRVVRYQSNFHLFSVMGPVTSDQVLPLSVLHALRRPPRGVPATGFGVKSMFTRAPSRSCAPWFMEKSAGSAGSSTKRFPLSSADILVLKIWAPDESSLRVIVSIVFLVRRPSFST